VSRKKTQRQKVRGGQGPVPARKKRNKPPDRPGPPDRPVFEPNAAGIDIGAREILVAVPADREEHPVRKCETFSGDLHQMAEWLVSCGITTAAMESTSVYWIPVLQRIGATRHPAVFGEPAEHEKRAGQAHRFS
jgi:hypothetical protein